METAPDSGYRLRNEVMINIDPNARQFARDMLHEVVETYPQGSATLEDDQFLCVGALVHKENLGTGVQHPGAQSDVRSRFEPHRVEAAVAEEPGGKLEGISAQGVC